jgi:hypothetical protein
MIGEVGHHLSKFLYCIVDFLKAFYSVSREALFQRLRDIGISEILIVLIGCLYEVILGCLCTMHTISDFIRSTSVE